MSARFSLGERLQVRSRVTRIVFTVSLLATACSLLGRAQQAGCGAGEAVYAALTNAPAPQSEAGAVIGHTFGNAILPSILHQDPQYFRVGYGAISCRSEAENPAE